MHSLCYWKKKKIKEVCLWMDVFLCICVRIEKPLEEEAPGSTVDTTGQQNWERRRELQFPLYIFLCALIL